MLGRLLVGVKEKIQNTAVEGMNGPRYCGTRGRSKTEKGPMVLSHMALDERRRL